MREIYEVYAKIVDANGTYNTLSGYPKVFDSRGYSDDIPKARQRAYGAWHEALGAMAKVDTRQIQIAMLLEVSTGRQIEMAMFGAFPEDPEPEPEPEPEE